ncbi:hypothetical protein [Helicobacter sp. MIT 14-3879]|uniref:hypothetical protein n=1 Tax=Helicobacter sp. MIT 14-3879 TaxID=2040649 RepID=UPI000E1F4029|nr:hypothetical protein [Helicobacter sp. MIT 14-3879]RDU62625.1 hypothetical protein CQA44_06470 [Helicobacter sp. MIT 14-3879]
MVIILRFIISALIGVGWLFFSKDPEISLILFIFVFIILSITPKKNKTYEEGDEFQAILKEKTERKLLLEEERLLEKQQSKKNKK